MRIVVDSNVLLTYFWKDSVLREICKSRKVQLFAPEFALKEFKKHAKHMAKKAGLTQRDIKRVSEDLLSQLIFIDYEDYSRFFADSWDSIEDLPEKERAELSEDLDFLATARFVSCPIWSNDKLLTRQKEVIVLNTKEIISLLDV